MVKLWGVIALMTVLLVGTAAAQGDATDISEADAFDAAVLQQLPLLSPAAVAADALVVQQNAVSNWPRAFGWPVDGVLGDPLTASPCTPMAWGFVACMDFGPGTTAQMVGLYVENQGLEGSLASEVGNITSLRFLSMENNTLSGELPGEWRQLRALQSMSLRNNDLSGDLPAAWAALGSLTRLDMSGNLLTGTIPQAWNASLTQLKVLDLSGNEGLCGDIPSGLRDALEAANGTLGTGLGEPCDDAPVAPLWSECPVQPANGTPPGLTLLPSNVALEAGSEQGHVVELQVEGERRGCGKLSPVIAFHIRTGCGEYIQAANLTLARTGSGKDFLLSPLAINITAYNGSDSVQVMALSSGLLGQRPLRSGSRVTLTLNPDAPAACTGPEALFAPPYEYAMFGQAGGQTCCLVGALPLQSDTRVASVNSTDALPVDNTTLGGPLL